MMAFPNNSDIIGHHGGMDLLDYFAANITDLNFADLQLEDAAKMVGMDVPENHVWDNESVLKLGLRVNAFIRYELAQAMVDERNRRYAKNP